MKTALSFLIAAAVLLAQPPERIIITGARVLDVAAGRYVAPAFVIVEGGRVAGIHPKLPPPLGSEGRRIDLKDATLVPGLGDMNAVASPMGPLDADYFYALALANGVTMFRALDARLPWTVGQRDRVQAGEVVAPRIWTSGPGVRPALAPPVLAAFSATGGTGSTAAPVSPQLLLFPRASKAPAAILDVPDQTAVGRAVQSQIGAGVDWLKVHGTSTPEIYRAVIAAARQARVKVAGEAIVTSMAQASQLGVDSIEGLGTPARSVTEYVQLFRADQGMPRDDLAGLLDFVWGRLPAGDASTAIAALARSRTAIVPLLRIAADHAVPDAALGDPALEQLPEPIRQPIVERLKAGLGGAPRSAAGFQARLDFVRALSKAGGKVVTGSGSVDVGYPVPGAAIHSEIALLVRAGLTPLEAIRAATTACATLVGAEASAGQIKTGYQADFFAVQGDPLSNVEDLARIVFIMRGGEALDRAQLLEQARRATQVVR